MNGSINAYLLKPLLTIVKRFHLTLLIVVIVAGLIGSMFILNDILDLSPGINEQDPAFSTSFDDSTVERLRNLNRSADNLSNHQLPTGRINPFSP